MHANTNANPSDEWLMQQVANGELDAVSVLFRQHNRSLYGFFMYAGQPKEASEDMVQTVFERVLRYRQSYRASMPFRAWMFQIARNVLHDQRKHAQRDVRTDFLQPDLPPHLIQSVDNEYFEHEERFARLEKALRHLPHEQMEVLLLTRYQKLKYHEVAEILDCSVDAVKQRVFRAIARLRDVYFQLEHT